MALLLQKDISSLSDLRALIKSVLSKTTRTAKPLQQLSDVIHYKDVLFYSWKILSRSLGSSPESGDIFMLNILELLEKIAVSKSTLAENLTEDEILGLQKGRKKFVLDVSILQKHIRKVWQLLINRHISPGVHRKLLIMLLELYLPKLENPIFLTDFLMASLNVKGVVRILALQGIAMLMQKNNIEYPNIYGKLYTMFEPKVFHTKYKSRLFYLANIFLSSMYLPEILVASFAKRASRLSLTCSSPDVLIILKFVGNLLLRHAGLIKMIHHPSLTEVPEDPFIMEEEDPTKTKATESSLWELELHNNHCQPAISSAAKFIHFILPSIEYDLGQVLNNTYQDMFELECKKKDRPSLTFQRPQETVSRLKDDRLFKLWSLAG